MGPTLSEKRKKLVHISIREDLYLKLWQIVKKRYPIPLKKLNEVINEALNEYIEKHKNELT